MDYEFWFTTKISEGTRCNFRITQENVETVSYFLLLHFKIKIF